MRPGRPDSATTRSDRNTASSMAWVMNSTVVRSCAVIAVSSSCRRWRVMASTAANGSSISSTVGLLASTRATAARWRMPPESWCGYLFSKPLRPTSSTKRWVIASRSSFGRPLSRRPELDVGGRRLPRQQRVFLEHHAAIGAGPGHLAARHDDLARGRPVEAGDDAQEGRLAAARRADHRDEFVRPDRRATCRRAPRRCRSRPCRSRSSTRCARPACRSLSACLLQQLGMLGLDLAPSPCSSSTEMRLELDRRGDQLLRRRGSRRWSAATCAVKSSISGS